MKAYRHAAVERITVEPKQRGLGPIGHIGYFRPQAASLWQETLDWFCTQPDTR
jgi:predicted alpha/beta hydrolase